jgi:hypothetical protein
MKKRTRGMLAKIIGCAMFAVFFYGLIRFPDSPIHRSADGHFIGKQGQPRTLQDYQAFAAWEKLLFCIWPLGMLLVFWLNRDDPKNA